MLKHIVCWKIKEESKQENLKKMKDLLEALPAQIPVIKGFEVGLNAIHSDSSYDISLYSAFENEESLKSYQNHPAHVEAGVFFKSVTEKRVVVDYYI